MKRGLMVLTVGVLCLSCAETRAAHTRIRWEHWCADFDGVPTNERLMKAGQEGWELVSLSFRPPVVQNGNSVGGGATFLCFKRPQ